MGSSRLVIVEGKISRKVSWPLFQRGRKVIIEGKIKAQSFDEPFLRLLGEALVMYGPSRTGRGGLGSCRGERSQWTIQSRWTLSSWVEGAWRCEYEAVMSQGWRTELMDWPGNLRRIALTGRCNFLWRRLSSAQTRDGPVVKFCLWRPHSISQKWGGAENPDLSNRQTIWDPGQTAVAHPHRISRDRARCAFQKMPDSALSMTRSLDVQNTSQRVHLTPLPICRG